MLWRSKNLFRKVPTWWKQWRIYLHPYTFSWWKLGFCIVFPPKERLHHINMFGRLHGDPLMSAATVSVSKSDGKLLQEWSDLTRLLTKKQRGHFMSSGEATLNFVSLCRSFSELQEATRPYKTNNTVHLVCLKKLNQTFPQMRPADILASNVEINALSFCTC